MENNENIENALRVPVENSENIETASTLVSGPESLCIGIEDRQSLGLPLALQHERSNQEPVGAIGIISIGDFRCRRLEEKDTVDAEGDSEQ